eukprot:2138140-Alexandrium_andersonii.AAC.1
MGPSPPATQGLAADGARSALRQHANRKSRAARRPLLPTKQRQATAQRSGRRPAPNARGCKALQGKELGRLGHRRFATTARGGDSGARRRAAARQSATTNN